MLNLILNENMKIYRRLRTWILVGVLVVFTVGMFIIGKSLEKPQKEVDWKVQTQQSVNANKAALTQAGVPKVAKKQIEAEIKVGEYRLEHDLPPSTKSIWNGVLNAAGLISLVSIFTVVIAADTVAGEFANGTIKLLLIRPSSRSKILLSKYLATLIFAILLLVVLFLTAFGINGLLRGFQDVGAQYLYASNVGVVHSVPLVTHVLSKFAYASVDLVMIVTLAFMISTVFRSSALSIALSIGLLLTGQTISMFLTSFSWSKYILFLNTDLTQHLEGRPFVEGMTMQFSIMVLIVYFLIFNVLSWTIFNKRDVAA